MAIQYITPTQLSKDTASGNLAITGGTAIVATDTFKVPYPQEGKLLIMINNTFAGTKNVTLGAGSIAPDSKKGALSISLAQNDVKFIQPTSARFKDNDGYISITFDSGTTGFVRAVLLD